ncbi:DUF2497 domain-containing protein [uncultured Bartonella sp.]|uniref:DUF2497 domain-containing protein n=1 Tax=uncultured Bartonella sp. TaxID=104108 RepID=UPI00262C4108|nr:DUF2497 domain-containing protein [uncultured Bartonella sp.]
MAQSSNALREPTTDEILTSIREIIEENTGRISRPPVERGANVNHRNVADSSPSVSARSMAQQSLPQSSASARPVNPQTLTVDDAMRALAARIGLNVESSSNNSGNSAGQDVYQDQPSQKNANFDHVAENRENIKGQRIQDDNMPVQAANTVFSRRNADNDQNYDDMFDDNAISMEISEKIDALAEAALRPIVVRWLEKHWPDLVDKILREEIANVFEHHFSSECA